MRLVAEMALRELPPQDGWRMFEPKGAALYYIRVGRVHIRVPLSVFRLLAPY